jgi:hypothetical protein
MKEPTVESQHDRVFVVQTRNSLRLSEDRDQRVRHGIDSSSSSAPRQLADNEPAQATASAGTIAESAFGRAALNSHSAVRKCSRGWPVRTPGRAARRSRWLTSSCCKTKTAGESPRFGTRIPSHASSSKQHECQPGLLAAAETRRTRQRTQDRSQAEHAGSLRPESAEETQS